MKKNDKIIATCIDMNAEGFGVVKHQGFVVFVKGMLKDEIGEVQILSVKKQYAYGKLITLTSSSKERITPKCSVYGKCGGCQLQHIQYQTQGKLKEQVIIDLLKKQHLELSVQPIISMEIPFSYRNKVQVPFGRDNHGELTYGFYRSNSNDMVPFEYCEVQTELSNQIIHSIYQLLKEFQITSIRHVLVKHAHSTDEIMIVLVSNEKQLLNQERIIEKLLNQYPQIKSIILNHNRRKDNVILGEVEELLYGTRMITDYLSGFRFNISSKSFYQINSLQTEKLYQVAIDLAELSKEDIVVDLYSGVGTIGIIVSPHVKKVYGVEIVKEAVEDAKENAFQNNRDNIEFYCGDALEAVKEFKQQGLEIDAVFVDPPRKGLNEQTIQILSELNPKKIVYISCNPVTLVRDLVLLQEERYFSDNIQPVDMFPQTSHVESIVLMSRKEK